LPATISHTTPSFPFGEEMAAQHAGGDFATRYKFNSKELDPQTGYYYYGARYYDLVVSRWLSVAPLAEKYPGITPYNYTLNNPIILTDRDGRDTVWIDQKKGYWLQHVKAKGNDVFIILSDDNKEVNRLELPENSLERLDTWAGEYGDERTGETSNGIDIYRIRGDKNAKKLFEFLANNTKVEWGWWQTGAPKIGELNFLTTARLSARESGGAVIFSKMLAYGYTLRQHVHSHPRSDYPSGLWDGLHDIGFATGVTDYYKKKYPNRSTPIFKIYHKPSKRYIIYNKDSMPEDFPNAIQKSLPTIIID